MNRPVADLSLDLDNKWSYLKTHGDESWTSLPSYLDVVVPLFLELLSKHQLKITVFVVGQDAEVETNLPALKQIVAAGHEIGNHSFHHEPWLQRYSPEQLEQEFDLAEAALAKITDQKLQGFRGPGYSLSLEVLDELARRGYLYDCSTLPTFIGPLARAYYLMRSNLSQKESEDRSKLFGSMRDGFRKLKPFFWQTKHGRLLEIPVTTIPFFRIPFHFSYLLFLAQRSDWLADFYFKFALFVCRLTGTAPSLLLHPLDFLGGDEIAELEFFPAMAMSGARKRQIIDRMLALLVRHYRIVPMSERASEEWLNA